jgi:hypothetical protein
LVGVGVGEEVELAGEGRGGSVEVVSGVALIVGREVVVGVSMAALKTGFSTGQTSSAVKPANAIHENKMNSANTPQRLLSKRANGLSAIPPPVPVIQNEATEAS